MPKSLYQPFGIQKYCTGSVRFISLLLQMFLHSYTDIHIARMQSCPYTKIMIRTLAFYTSIAIAVALLVLLILWGNTAWKTVTFLSAALPDAPTWLPTTEVDIERSTQHFTTSEQTRIIDLYHRSDQSDPSAGIVLVPGLSPDAHRDERLVQVAEALTAVDVVVAIPHSASMADLSLDSADIQLINDTFHFLTEHKLVASDRVGLAGFSVAGSYTLRAGLELDTSPTVLLAFGPFYDASDLLVDILSRSARYGDTTRDWHPDKHVQRITSQMLSANDATFSDPLPELSRSEAIDLVAELPSQQQTLLADISPASKLAALDFPLILMHDKHDTLIPVEASRTLIASLPDGSTFSYQEYTFLHHVTPEHLRTFELLPFAWQIFQLFNRLL